MYDQLSLFEDYSKKKNCKPYYELKVCIKKERYGFIISFC